MERCGKGGLRGRSRRREKRRAEKTEIGSEVEAGEEVSTDHVRGA